MRGSANVKRLVRRGRSTSPARTQLKNHFFDLRPARVGEAPFATDEDKTALLKHPDRGRVVPSGPGVEGPRRQPADERDERSGGHPLAPVVPPDPVADLALARPRGDEAQDVAGHTLA